MSTYSIASVSFINSFPFIYGINKYLLHSQFRLKLCEPSKCAQVFINGSTDIALIPVAALPQIGTPFNIITNYCIGAVNPVETVMLFSQVDIKNIKTIVLDVDSLTSVKLVKILAQNLWKVNPDYLYGKVPQTINKNDTKAYLAIGDKCFSLKNKFDYHYDLFESWFSLKKMPFVFAVWVAKPSVTNNFIDKLNSAFDYGLNNKEDALSQYLNNKDRESFMKMLNYLKNSISYNFDNDKRNALNEYLNLTKNID